MILKKIRVNVLSIYRKRNKNNHKIMNSGQQNGNKYNISSKARINLSAFRGLVESVVTNRDKSIINLTIGDPTINRELRPCAEIINSLIESIESNDNNGYYPFPGSQEGRKAVAK